MKNRTVRVNGKSYQKTAAFGNQALRVINRNKKVYTRKSKYPQIFN